MFLHLVAFASMHTASSFIFLASSASDMSSNVKILPSVSCEDPPPGDAILEPRLTSAGDKTLKLLSTCGQEATVAVAAAVSDFAEAWLASLFVVSHAAVC